MQRHQERIQPAGLNEIAVRACLLKTGAQRRRDLRRDRDAAMTAEHVDPERSGVVA